MESFVRYDNEKFVSEVPVSPLSTWVNIDLVPYLDDSSSLGVLLRVTKDIDIGPVTTFGVREVGSVGRLVNIGNEEFCEFPMKFVGAGKTVDFKNNESNIKLSVIGEVHAPHVKLHDAPTDKVLAFGDWFNVTPALIGGDVIDDVAAVIARVTHVAPTTTGTWGLREKGSDDLAHNSRGDIGYTMYIIGLSASGEYQYFTSSKFSFAQSILTEVGYILKSGSVVTITDPVDEVLSLQTPLFGVLDVSGVVASEASIVGGRWLSTSPLLTRPEAFLRATGSTDNGFRGHPLDSQLGQSVALDADLKAEYTLEDLLIDFWVQWYEVPSLPPPPSILGLARGTGEVGVAVAGTSEAGVAVAGTSEVGDAVEGMGEVSVAVEGTGEAGVAVAGQGQVLK